MTERKTITFSRQSVRRFRCVQRLLDQLDQASEPRALIMPGSPRPRGTIIVFPGSFNPPTSAHLAMLRQAHEFVRQREPALIYAAFSRHTVDKESVERPLLLDRILLLETLLQHRMRKSGILLFNRGLYVEEAEALRASFTGVERIFFLLGYDKIVQIFDPRYYNDRDTALNKLFKQAELLVALRGAAGEQDLAALLHRPENECFARYVHLLPLSGVYRAVSSTHVRQGEPAALRDVPSEVRRFMRETRAYAAPLRLRDGTEIDYYAERMKRIKEFVSISGVWGRGGR